MKHAPLYLGRRASRNHFLRVLVNLSPDGIRHEINQIFLAQVRMAGSARIDLFSKFHFWTTSFDHSVATSVGNHLPSLQLLETLNQL
jgi:hypothetical protein